ncbi:MAG TPA: glycosyltransferase [Cytophagales bacterium]|jgi:glycosyltransferase involved in cell wall biosynthesis|nr:glycosyltransferase [Cytophagales bacterium]
MKLSVVITVYNEQDNVQPLIEQLHQALEGIDHEVLFVNDGSTDKTLLNLKEFAYDRVKVVDLLRNSGQTAAMAAGIETAQGEYIVTMDGDLQNDPSDIPMLLEKIENGHYDVIAGNRKNRKDGFILRKLPSKIANMLIRRLSGVHISDYGCSLKIFKSYFAKNLGLYGELHRFIPILAKLQGAKIDEIPVKHHPRIHGQSKYGLGRTLKVASDLILMTFFQKYFQKPMHLFGGTGILAFGLGIIINLYLLVKKIMGFDIWGRPILLLGIILILGGIQLITIGFVAEMILRTYFESQNKKTYIIKDIYLGDTAEKASKKRIKTAG